MAEEISEAEAFAPTWCWKEQPDDAEAGWFDARSFEEACKAADAKF